MNCVKNEKENVKTIIKLGYNQIIQQFITIVKCSYGWYPFFYIFLGKFPLIWLQTKNPKKPLIRISTFAQKWKLIMMQESSTYMMALMANLPTLFL